MEHMDQVMEAAERAHIVGEGMVAEVHNHDIGYVDKAEGTFGQDIVAGLDCKGAVLVIDCEGLAVIEAVEVQDVGLEEMMEKLELAVVLGEQGMASENMEIQRKKVKVTERENKANS